MSVPSRVQRYGGGVTMAEATGTEPAHYRDWRPLVRASAASALIEAAIFLVVGFFVLRNLVFSLDSSPLFVTAVKTVAWAFRLGGTCLLAVGLLALIPWRYAPLTDTVVSGAVGLVFVIGGGIWVTSDFMGAIVLLFGLMSLNSARNAWATHRLIGPMAASNTAPSASATLEHMLDDAAQDDSASTPSETKTDHVPEGSLAEFGRDKPEEENKTGKDA